MGALGPSLIPVYVICAPLINLHLFFQFPIYMPLTIHTMTSTSSIYKSIPKLENSLHMTHEFRVCKRKRCSNSPPNLTPLISNHGDAILHPPSQPNDPESGVGAGNSLGEYQTKQSSSASSIAAIQPRAIFLTVSFLELLKEFSEKVASDPNCYEDEITDPEIVQANLKHPLLCKNLLLLFKGLFNAQQLPYWGPANRGYGPQPEEQKWDNRSKTQIKEILARTGELLGKTERQFRSIRSLRSMDVGISQ